MSEPDRRRRAAGPAVVLGLGLLLAAVLALSLAYGIPSIGFPTRGPGGVGGSASFHASDVSREKLGGAFTLTDPDNRLRSLSDFRGKVVILTFGYTHCPDFCPTTLAKLAEVRRLLGADGAHVQVLFVTVDPQRDSAQLLARYLPTFDPSFIGLRGTEDQIDAVTQAYGAIYQIVQYQGQTLVDHTASSYVIDPRGQTRLVSPYDQTARSLAEDLKTLLRAG